MDAGALVKKRCDERQDWEFRSHKSRLVAGPIDLGPAEMKTVLEKIPRDRGHVALPPAPGIDERLIDLDQPDHECGQHHRDQKISGPACGKILLGHMTL